MSDHLQLFDFGDRTRHDPARYSEAHFVFLNRSAWPEARRVRDELEDWFGRYPATADDPARERRDLQGRFRSPMDVVHTGASFELFLHELLVQLGCGVVVHSSIPGSARRPDFRVTPPAGDPFYLEAVLATGESEAAAAAKARLNSVYDALNALESPNFFISVDVEGELLSPAPAARMRRFLAEHLAALDPEVIAELWRTGGIEAVPRWRLDHEGCRFEFQPIPIKEEARGRPGRRPIGTMSAGARVIDPRTPVRDAIMGKAERFKALDLPLIIAVNALDSFVDRDAVLEALFGREAIRVRAHDVGSSDPEPFRILDGAFTTPSGPRYTRVSGVLMACMLNHWSIGSTADLRLYHNPYAVQRLTLELARLPQAVPQDGKMTWVDGDVVGRILGLPDRWPMDSVSVDAAE
jgi:hypothetical protein